MTVRKKLRAGTIAALGLCLAAGIAFAALPARADAEPEANADAFEVIEGASIRLKNPTGLRFKVRLGENVKNGADAVGMYIFPATLLESVTENNYEAIEPITLDLTSHLYPEEDGYWYGNGVVADILPANLSLEYVAVAYTETDGERTYTEAQTADGRSVAKVAEAAYSDYNEDRSSRDILKTFLEEDYPELDTYYAGLGSEASPYLISNDEDFAYFAEQVEGGEAYEGKYFRLTENITAQKCVGSATYLASSGYVVDEENSKPFAGVFDGNEKTITVALTGTGGTNSLALFPYNKGTVKNFTTEGSLSAMPATGAVCVAFNETGATVEKVTNRVELNFPEAFRIGGICYKNSGTIKDCINEGNITAKYGMAGIAMSTATGSETIGCTNKGNIECAGGSRVQTGATDGGWVGGVVGMHGTGALIDDCRNEGEVKANGGQMSQTGYAGVGGIAGCSWKATSQIKNSTNTGAVVGNFYVGGIVGWGKGVLDTCTNEGNISALGGSDEVMYSAGILGYGASDSGDTPVAEIKSCVNKGSVAGQNCVGGIVGKIESPAANITGTSNEGAVTATGTWVGGLIGHIGRDVSVTDCENKASGVVSGDSHVGGICGRIDYADVTFRGLNNYAPVTATGGDAVTFASDTGGILGSVNNAKAMKEFKLCINHDTATVTGKTNIGGICGYFQGGTVISECDNAATIQATGDTVGGIVGMCASNFTIEDCDNTGAVNGRGVSTGSFFGVGGIVGTIYDKVVVKGCSNTGAVTGDRFVGGIVGSQAANNRTGADIQNCTNDGVVTANSTNTSGAYCGGIAGYIADGKLTDCKSNTPIVVQDAAKANTGALCGKQAKGTENNSGNTQYQE